ncbi:unnamed protein product [Paramecium primaurelia]|uniref:Uncharacterized protein n=1 Tax=Paramecium primaurelia TaxID=5886 RepID=A0A8S1NHE4_PARPR|nr:unnamed protein product [Paramecium primaurelia]
MQYSILGVHLILIEIIKAYDEEYDIEIKSITPILIEFADTTHKIVVNFISQYLQSCFRRQNHQHLKQHSVIKRSKIGMQISLKMSEEQQQIMKKTSIVRRSLFYVIIILSRISFYVEIKKKWNKLEMFSQLYDMKFHNIEYLESFEYSF